MLQNEHSTSSVQFLGTFSHPYFGSVLHSKYNLLMNQIEKYLLCPTLLYMVRGIISYGRVHIFSSLFWLLSPHQDCYLWLTEVDLSTTQELVPLDILAHHCDLYAVLQYAGREVSWLQVMSQKPCS